MSALRHTVLPALFAVALAVPLTALTAASLHSLRYLYWTGDAWWMPADVAGPHPPLAWILGGLLPAAALGYAFARGPDHRVLRIAVGLWGLAQVVFGGLFVVSWSQWQQHGGTARPPFPTLDVVAFGLAAVVAVAFAAGSITRPRSRREAVAAGILAMVLSAGLCTPSIVRSVLDATPQSLPPFELRFVSAVLVAEPALVPAEELVEQDGVPYRLEYADAWSLPSREIQRVHWQPDESGAPGFVLVLRDDVALRERSMRRRGQRDALLLDGEFVAVPTFGDALLDGRLYYCDASGRDRGEVAALYRALTGLTPP